MNPTLVIGIVFLCVSAILTLFGYLIAVKKQLSLIAGYDPNRVKDKEGLAKWVGNGIMIMGGLEILISLLIFVFPPNVIPVLALAFVIVNIGGVVVLFTR